MQWMNQRYSIHARYKLELKNMKTFYTATLLVAAAIFVNASSIGEETAGNAVNDAVKSEKDTMAAKKLEKVSDDMPDFWQMDEVADAAGTHTVAAVLASAAEAAEEAMESVEPVQKHRHQHDASSSAAAPEKSLGAAEFHAEVDSHQEDVLTSPEAQMPPADVKETQPMTPQADNKQEGNPATKFVDSIKRFFNNLRGASN
ncbi:hypothetical protein K450DRAFT_219903 [Umbelopsis ramanniana AG]|uniref:Uncharacterized protein n=1 Tax=Umbelopsis ramanniana AG TaxID=1314678 RepID=A0AAD5EH77_UMBRA|nr:uncharacterized protein K450DRAFT_219903 [Umbelopsis ramanniana AG]KAI8583768.1 hypothetical protein K450DRAFT_219903 [Umbelopsis ramanniana AG]